MIRLFPLDSQSRTLSQKKNENHLLNNDKHINEETKNDGEEDNGELNVEGSPKTFDEQSDIEVIDKATTRNEDVPIVNKRQAVENDDLTKPLVGYFLKIFKHLLSTLKNIIRYCNINYIVTTVV